MSCFSLMTVYHNGSPMWLLSKIQESGARSVACAHILQALRVYVLTCLLTPVSPLALRSPAIFVCGSHSPLPVPLLPESHLMFRSTESLGKNPVSSGACPSASRVSSRFQVTESLGKNPVSSGGSQSSGKEI